MGRGSLGVQGAGPPEELVHLHERGYTLERGLGREGRPVNLDCNLSATHGRSEWW